jgi:hypothetical protein
VAFLGMSAVACAASMVLSSAVEGSVSYDVR